MAFFCDIIAYSPQGSKRFREISEKKAQILRIVTEGLGLWYLRDTPGKKAEKLNPG